MIIESRHWSQSPRQDQGRYSALMTKTKWSRHLNIGDSPATPSRTNPPLSWSSVKNFLVDTSNRVVLKSWPHIVYSRLLKIWSNHLHRELFGWASCYWNGERTLLIGTAQKCLVYTIGENTWFVSYGLWVEGRTYQVTADARWINMPIRTTEKEVNFMMQQWGWVCWNVEQ
jgi:hypothetical protein